MAQDITQKHRDRKSPYFFHQRRLCMSAGVRVDLVCRLASGLIRCVGWRRRRSCVSAGVDVGRARRPISTEAVVRYRPRCEGKNEWRNTTHKNTEVEKVRIFSSAPVVHVGWCQG
jgi:hypothetical protein